MPSNSSDRNLLFGVVALQMDFIKRDQLIEAMTAWASDKRKPIGQILVEKKYLSHDKRDLLEQLADAHVATHGNDPQQSLAALSSVSSVQRELSLVPDSELQASVSHLGAGALGEIATRSQTAGELSSEGMRFEIKRFHAAGGLGQVFVAHDKELNREVALKEIKPERAFDVKNQGRFLLEAEITGGLEHPGIVPVYGLGHYQDGRPFYAMRFIKGESLYDHIKRFHESSLRGTARNLALRELLGRFLDVCDAVQYAHDRGVLHRDLKPGNVMLGKYGETLVVDWGLAKASDKAEPSHDGEPLLSPSSGSQVPATEAGKGFGTPGYMSPEQARGEIDKLGPATDVYALGATLYCLLTGKSPIGRVKDKDPNEVERAVFQPEPPRSLDPTISPALNAICLKAMSFELKDRYENCRQLAEDLRHWLADEPVSALPDKLAAMSLRWMRKNPGRVSALGASVTVGMVAALLGIILIGAKNTQLSFERDSKANALRDVKIQFENAEAQRRIADEQRKVATRNEETAKLERNRTDKALDFLIESFRKPDPEYDGMKLTVAEMLKQASAEAKSKFSGDPLMLAKVLSAIERTYFGLGIVSESLALAKFTSELATSSLGEDHVESLKARSNLGSAYSLAGDFRHAIPLLETVRKKRSQLSDGQEDLIITTNELALAYCESGQIIKAIPLLEEIFPVAVKSLGKTNELTLSTVNSLALAYQYTGNVEKAAKLYESIIGEMQPTRSGGRANSRYLTTMSNLAGAYQAMGHVERATDMFTQILASQKELLGPTHYDTLTTLNNLGMAYIAARQFVHATAIFEEAVAKFEQTVPKDHPRLVGAKSNLALAYMLQGNFEKSIEINKQVIETFTRLGANTHALNLKALHNLAIAYKKLSRLTDAETCFRDFVTHAIRMLRQLPPELVESIPEALDWLVDYHTQKGNKVEADKYREMRKKFPGPLKKAGMESGKGDGKIAKPNAEPAPTKAPNSDAPKKAGVPAKK